jgi:hypothetical protein
MVAVLAIFLVIANAPERAPKSYQIYHNSIPVESVEFPSNGIIQLRDGYTSQTVLVISENP